MNGASDGGPVPQGELRELTRDERLQAAAGGNPEALAFLRAFAVRAHWIDDLADKGPALAERPEAAAEMLARNEADWLLTLSTNPFFLAHRLQLVPLMVLGLNAWVDSHRQPPVVRDVVKGFWHETVWAVAYLTGGWTRLRQVTSRNRSYDLEPGKPEEGR